MSALERPAEVLLLALFDAPGGAEAAARAILHSGVDADHVALLARGSRGTAFAAVPRVVLLHVPGLGRLVARGALAVELDSEPARAGGPERLALALRRMGISAADVPLLERAIRAGRILLVVAVPLTDAYRWGLLLQKAGALSLSARPRLGPWPARSPDPGHRSHEPHAGRRGRAA